MAEHGGRTMRPATPAQLRAKGVLVVFLFILAALTWVVIIAFGPGRSPAAIALQGLVLLALTAFSLPGHQRAVVAARLVTVACTVAATVLVLSTVSGLGPSTILSVALILGMVPPIRHSYDDTRAMERWNERRARELSRRAQVFPDSTSMHPTTVLPPPPRDDQGAEQRTPTVRAASE